MENCGWFCFMNRNLLVIIFSVVGCSCNRSLLSRVRGWWKLRLWSRSNYLSYAVLSLKCKSKWCQTPKKSRISIQLAVLWHLSSLWASMVEEVVGKKCRRVEREMEREKQNILPINNKFLLTSSRFTTWSQEKERRKSPLLMAFFVFPKPVMWHTTISLIIIYRHQLLKNFSRLVFSIFRDGHVSLKGPQQVR